MPRSLRRRDSRRSDGASNLADVATTDDSFSTIDCNAEGLWWLIHTRPRQEKKLAEQLRSLDVAHYLPVTKCTAFTRGLPRVTQAPLFPGYLFLWADVAQRRAALETNRIVATHRVDDQADLSERLWTLAELIEKGVPLRVEERLAAGQRVRVKSGVLKDKQGTIIKRQGKTRLFVFMNHLLGGVSMEIDQYLLEPCGES